MQNAIKVSVVVPTKDALRWLPAALASIGQTEGVEILVVDDGSSDGTAEYLVGKMALDSRVRAMWGPRTGPAAARNLAIREARGGLIAFLDADDRWRPGKLQLQMAIHQANPSVGLSFTGYMHVTEDGIPYGSSLRYWPTFGGRHKHESASFDLGPDAFAQIYAENIIGTSTVVARREILLNVGGFDESLNQAEDWDLWLKIAGASPIVCLPSDLADYLIHRPGNLSGFAAKRSSALQVVAERHRAAAMLLSPSSVRVCAGHLFAARAEAAHLEGRPARAAILRFKSFLASPSRRSAKEAAVAAVEPLRALHRPAVA